MDASHERPSDRTTCTLEDARKRCVAQLDPLEWHAEADEEDVDVRAAPSFGRWIRMGRNSIGLHVVSRERRFIPSKEEGGRGSS